MAKMLKAKKAHKTVRKAKSKVKTSAKRAGSARRKATKSRATKSRATKRARR